MPLFTLDKDNVVTACAATDQVPVGENIHSFTSQKELERLSQHWLTDRLVDIWNGFAGEVPFDDLKPVRKFTDRKTAVARIWKALQRLEASVATPAPNVAPKRAKASKQTTTKDAAPTAREGSKKAIVIELLRRPGGATLQELMSVTSWQSHSLRGFISGGLVKKLGLTIKSIKQKDGQRVYRIATK